MKTALGLAMTWAVCVAGVLVGGGTSQAAEEQIATIDGTGTKVILKSTGDWIQAPASAGSQTAGEPAAVAPPGAVRTEPAAHPAAPPAAASRQAPAAGTIESLDPALRLKLAVAGGALLLVVLALVLFFLVIQPARRRRLLREALALLATGSDEGLNEAEGLLNRAITAGLRAGDIKEAYFARGYVHARHRIYDRAVADLAQADRSDPAVLYLEIWTRVQQEKYKEAFDVFAGNEESIRGFAEGPRLMSIACFQLAKEHWKNRAMDEAIGYFERVRELGVHADKVPASVSDHQTTLGVVALYDNQVDEARGHFSKALDRAGKEQASSLPAEVGLLLCRWRESEHPLLDDEVGKVVAGLAAHSQAAKPPAAGQGKQEKKEAGGDEPELTDDELMTRNVLLWHAVSLLHTFNHRSSKSGLFAADREELQRRTAKVLAVDAKMPDPKLLLGLIDYFFFNELNKDAALKTLKDSGTTVPEVSLILSREEKVKDMERDLLKTFIDLVKSYVGDHEVPMSVRETLIASLEKHSRFKKLRGDVTLAVEEAGPGGGATLSGLQSRAMLLRKRIGTIVKPALAGAERSNVGALEKLMVDMETDTTTIREAASKLEKKELELMVGTGEFLLKEEEPAPALRPRELLRPPAPLVKASAAPVRPLPAVRASSPPALSPASPTQGGPNRGPNTRD